MDEKCRNIFELTVVLVAAARPCRTWSGDLEAVAAEPKMDCFTQRCPFEVDDLFVPMLGFEVGGSRNGFLGANLTSVPFLPFTWAQVGGRHTFHEGASLYVQGGFTVLYLFGGLGKAWKGTGDHATFLTLGVPLFFMAETSWGGEFSMTSISPATTASVWIEKPLRGKEVTFGVSWKIPVSFWTMGLSAFR